MKVSCGECGHAAEITNASDAWKCNCAAGVSNPDGCGCDATNVAADVVEDNPPDNAGEIAQLEARLAELRGTAAPEGDVDA